MPTLIMRGQYDGIASIEDLLKFFEKLPNPDKQFTVMPGISHASFQQKNYVLVYHILASFFAQPEPVIAESGSSEAEFPGQVRQILRRVIDLHRRRALARVRAVLVDPRGVRRAQSQFCRRFEIVAVRGHHHALLGREIECRASGEINARLALESPAISAPRIASQGNRCGGRDRPSTRCFRSTPAPATNFRLQPRQRRRHVRPGIEPVPNQRQIVQHLVGQVLQAEARQQSFETLPMQHVELGKRACRPERTSSKPGWYSPRQASAKAVPIEVIPKGAEDFFALAGDRRAPVDHRPEYVEKQRFETGVGVPRRSPPGPTGPVLGGQDRG